MAIIEDTFTPALDRVLAQVTAVPSEIAAVRALDDRALLVAQRKLADIQRALGSPATLLAGEISHRSRRELGYGGLAQREGYRNPESLIQHVTGSTSREATTLVQVGVLVHDAVATAHPDLADPEYEVREPWLEAVGTAVRQRELSIDAANAIRAGLGQPTPADVEGSGVTATELAAAAVELVALAPGLHVGELLRRARQLRDDLDEAGIADRERAIYLERSIKRMRRPNGASRYIVDTDLESGAFWDDLYDKITSPRRNGPRFIDAADQQWAESISADERTLEQYVHDSLTELLRIAATSGHKESKRIVGSRMPAVRVLVTADSLSKRAGHGYIEGNDIPVSIATVERLVCTSGTVPIVFDSRGQVLDLGREQRLFSPQQKLALCARDGGCMAPGCNRPASFTEAHHINHFQSGGETNIADGILLCRYHHMLLHNNGWEIEREGAEYWLIPPREVDPQRGRRHMPSKSAARRELLRQHESALKPERQLATVQG
jgi:hypothetical protein